MELVKSINEEVTIYDSLAESGAVVCNNVLSSENKEVITESIQGLKDNIKRILSSNKRISPALANHIARIIIFANEVDLELQSSKKLDIKNYLTDILKLASDMTTKQLKSEEQHGGSKINMSDNIKHLLGRLQGNAEKKIKVQDTFTKILDKMEKSSSKSHLDIMKIASKILQGNKDIAKRKELIEEII